MSLSEIAISAAEAGKTAQKLLKTARFILFGRMDHVSTFAVGTQDAVSEID